MSLYLLIGLLFAIAVAVFAVSNTDPVTVNFIFSELQTSLALVIVGSATAGAIVVGIFAAVKQIGLRLRVWDRENRARKHEKEATELRRKVAELEQEVAQLNEELTEAEAYVDRLEQLVRERDEELGRLRGTLASEPAAISEEDEAQKHGSK